MSSRAWGSFAAVSFLWGIPYLFIAIAVDDGVGPVFLAWSRVVLAAVILIVIASRAGLLGSLRGRLGWLLAYAIAEIAIPFPLIAFGEKHVSSSVAAILVAATPLIVAVLAIGFDESERVGGRRLAGLWIGFAGVVALVGVDLTGDGDLVLGTAAILVAAVGYAIGPMTLRRKLGDLDPVAIMAGALTIAGLVLTPLAATELPTDGLSASALAAIAVLGLLCTAAAFVLFGSLVIEVGAGRALVITYVAPVIALAAGVIVLGESVGLGTVVGLPLIVGGSWLATSARSRERKPRGA